MLVENGGFGAQSAAPIARQVMDYYLLHQRAGGPAAEDAEADEADESVDAEPKDEEVVEPAAEPGLPARGAARSPAPAAGRRAQ